MQFPAGFPGIVGRAAFTPPPAIAAAAIVGDFGPHYEAGPAAADWTVTDGALPSGLSLDPATGQVLGITSATGSFEATIAADTTTRKLAFTVAPYAAQPRGAAWWRQNRANTPTIADSTGLTFAVRGALTAAAGTQTLFRSRVTATTHVDIILDSAGRISLTARLSTATNVTWRSTASVSSGAMATLSAVMDTTQALEADRCRVWLNGAPVAGAWTTAAPAQNAVLALAPAGTNSLIFAASDTTGGAQVTGPTSLEWIGAAAGVIAGASSLGPALPAPAGWWLLLGGSRQAWLAGSNAAGGSPFTLCRALPSTDSAMLLGPDLAQRDARRGLDGSHGWTLGTGWAVSKDTGRLSATIATTATARFTFASPLRVGVSYLVRVARNQTAGTLRLRGVRSDLVTVDVTDTSISEGAAGAPVDFYAVVTPATADWTSIELARAAGTLTVTDVGLSVQELRHAQPLAFPGAVGYGRWTTGGRSGDVRRVTLATDGTGPGTLRWALAGENLAVGQDPITAVTGWTAGANTTRSFTSSDLRLVTTAAAVGTMSVTYDVTGLVAGRTYSSHARPGFIATSGTPSQTPCASLQWRVLTSDGATVLAESPVIPRPSSFGSSAYFDLEVQFVAPVGGAVRLQLLCATDSATDLQRAVLDAVTVVSARTVIIEPGVGQVRLASGPITLRNGAITIDARRAPGFYASLARLEGRCSNAIVRGWRAYVGNEGGMPADWPGSNGWTIQTSSSPLNVSGQAAVDAKVWRQDLYGTAPWWINTNAFPANTPLGQAAGARDGISWGQTNGPTRDLYFDGCEVMWGCDESLSLFRTGGTQANLLSDATVHRSIIGEALYESGHIDENEASRTPKEHSKGVLLGPHSARISLIENLLATNHDRNPQLSGFSEDMELINNAIVNFGENGINLFGNCADELLAAGEIASLGDANARIQTVLAAADPATSFPVSWRIIVAAQSRVNVLGNLLQRADNTGAGAVAVDADTTRAPIRIQNDVPGRVALAGNVFIKKNGTLNAIASIARGDVNASGSGSVTPVTFATAALPFGSGFTPRLPGAINQASPAAGDETAATAFARDLRARLASVVGARHPDGSLHPVTARLVAECFPEQLAAVLPQGTPTPGYVAPTDARTEARNWVSGDGRVRPPDRHGLVVANPALFGLASDPWAGAANGAVIGGAGP